MQRSRNSLAFPKSTGLTLVYYPSPPPCQGFFWGCHLRIKSGLFFKDLKFKSGHLRTHNLKPKGGFRLWYSYTKNSQTARSKKNLVRFAHNWNIGILELWNNGLWENGKMGELVLDKVRDWQNSS